MSRWPVCLLSLAFSLVVTLAACEGCRGTNSPDAGAAVPAVRLYLISDFAGALEPCGCVKDQLGGTDHFGALVANDKASKAHGVLAAGPTFFLDMELTAEKRSQEVAKAETIAASLKGLGLLGFAPGRNEWAGGPDVLGKLVAESGAPMLAANLTAPGAPPTKWTIKEIGGIKLGLVGVSSPEKAKTTLEGATSTSPADAVKTAVEALKKDGAQAIIALAAVGRGEAKRIADVNPDLLAIVVGSTGGGGDENTAAPPAERIGDVLVIETANHLQTVAVLDLHVRDGAGKGLVKLADATGIDRIRKKEALTSRIDELRTKIAIWEKDHTVAKEDIDARKADVAKLEGERNTLDDSPSPATGSFYRYEMHDIREKLGNDDAVHKQMLAYYKKVNDENKTLFADRKPPPAPKGEASYVGIEVCSTCHEEPRAVWDKTQHAHAYKTLSDGFKEFNLDCVSCHVTGYDRPGGSTVTFNKSLQDVQCEQCHGPGSLHAAHPEKAKIPVAKPNADVCLSCHHPPHVHAFDAVAKMPEVLGPGHGRPKN